MMQATHDTQQQQLPKGNRHETEYVGYLARAQARFRANIAEGKEPIFTTDADELFPAYLATMPDDRRQFHTCTACRHFVERFGGLVTIDETGQATSALWNVDDAPPEYRDGIAAMLKIVNRARVTGVFLSSDATWGTPKTGDWIHWGVVPPRSILHNHALLTAGQRMAEKREEFGMVCRGLADFTLPMIEQALTLLRTDALYRAEKVIGPAEWLRALHVARNGARKDRRENIVWRAVALAPSGFCHPRSSMVGTLLEDIASGMDFDEVSRRFKAKMHPLQYQRPTSEPSVGNIAQAEKVIATLKASGSLDRRFARIEECDLLWAPAATKETPKTGGVFGHLHAKDAAPALSAMVAPAQAITFEKFRRVVLPDTIAMDVMVPTHGNFIGLLTAAQPDAPPILQWDSEERRNPVSHYVYNGGSPASSWGLIGGQWDRVTGLTLMAHQWYGGTFQNHAPGAIIIIDGAKDSRTGQGNALFPETLRSEFHAIRSTIEAYSRSAQIGGRDEASANGIQIGKSGAAHVRVTLTNGTRAEYKIDRLD